MKTIVFSLEQFLDCDTEDELLKVGAERSKNLIEFLLLLDLGFLTLSLFIWIAHLEELVSPNQESD